MPNSDRLEREIEEILGKIEQFPEADSRRRRARRRRLKQVGTAMSNRQQAAARQLSRISLSQVMLLSFVLILGSFFFRRMGMPPLLMEWAMYGGIILFVTSFAITMFSGARGRSRTQARWRGRPIESTGPTVSQRMRRWWNSRSTRR